MGPGSWHALRVRVPARASEIVLAWLWEQTITGIVEEGPGCYVAYATRPWSEKEALAAFAARMGEAVPGGHPPKVVIETFEVADQDWSRSWKESWRPTPLGERLLVVPAWWKEVDPGERAVVRIDPGTAFGTGTHATTRLAWELLEEAAGRRPPRRVLDVGTGSGLLSLGLLRLHPRARAVGTERDEAALASLRENLSLHPDERDRFLALCTGALPFREDAFDLAVANLTELEQRAVEAELASLLAPGGRLVLSGLLATQGDGTRARWLARGYRVEDSRTEEGWVALCLVRAMGDSTQP